MAGNNPLYVMLPDDLSTRLEADARGRHGRKREIVIAALRQYYSTTGQESTTTTASAQEYSITLPSEESQPEHRPVRLNGNHDTGEIHAIPKFMQTSKKTGKSED